MVLITESASSPEDALFLKQLAFERLNTGGEKLSRQEIRNCSFYSPFNQLLLELAGNQIFADAWNIPIDDEEEELQKNNLYKKMEDAELVLRFFALRNTDKFRNGMQKFLNLYMMKSVSLPNDEIEFLRNSFIQAINLAHQIYEDKLFKPFDPQSDTWENKAFKDYYDAVMVGFSRHLADSDANILLERKPRVIEKTKILFMEDKSKLFTGGCKTKADIQERIRLFDYMLSQVIAE